MPKWIFQMWFLIPAMTPWWWKSALDFVGLTEKDVTVPNYSRDWCLNESDTIFNHETSANVTIDESLNQWQWVEWLMLRWPNDKTATHTHICQTIHTHIQKDESHGQKTFNKIWHVNNYAGRQQSSPKSVNIHQRLQLLFFFCSCTQCVNSYSRKINYTLHSYRTEKSSQ